MTNLYSIKDVAKIFELSESKLRYWAQTGFVNPGVRRGGRWYYRFSDLIHVRAAKELLDAGLSVQNVRKNLDALRALSPQVAYPASRMRISSDGETIIARDHDDVFLEPLSGQLVMDFTVDSLSNHVADILALPTSEQHPETVAPLALAESSTAEAMPFLVAPRDERRPPDPVASVLDSVEYRPVGDRDIDAYALATAVHNDQIYTAASSADTRRSYDDAAGAKERLQASRRQPGADRTPESAYRLFVRGCEAEDRDEPQQAEAYYRRAIDCQPSLAAAYTNLGNLYYRRGDATSARTVYERALALQPAQPEARYNLSNVLEDIGEIELAIAEMRRVCWTHPDFADAHYNLGLLLARTGGTRQARVHLRRYLELDSQSDWSTRAREFLAALS